MPDELQEDTQERLRPRIGEDTTDIRGLRVERKRTRPLEAAPDLGRVVDACAVLLLGATLLTGAVAAHHADVAALAGERASASAMIAASDGAGLAVEGVTRPEGKGLALAADQRRQADAAARDAGVAAAQRSRFSLLNLASMAGMFLAGLAPASSRIPAKVAFLAMGSIVWATATAMLTLLATGT